MDTQSYNTYTYKKLAILCLKALAFLNIMDSCHNPKQLKTTFVGVVLASVKKPHHHQFLASKEADFRYATLF